MRRLHYAWAVAGVTFAVLLVAAGIRSTPGVLLVPIEHGMGWSAATVSAAAALNIALFGLTGPFAAALMQTFGLRNTMMLGLATTATGIFAASLAVAPWQLILCWGVIAGVGLGMLAMVLAATVAKRWFVAQRGLVMGALTASTATGQLIFLPLLATVADQHGWRSATWMVGVAAIVAMIPVAFFIRDRPNDIGVLPYGATEAVPPPPASHNPIVLAFTELGRASRSSSFWILAGTFFICGASTNGLIGTHFIAACGDHGIAQVTAASLLAVMGIFDLIGTTASGWLSDRVDNRLLLFMYYGLRGLSLFFLPAALGTGFGGLPVFAVFYGLDWIATVPPTVRLANKAFGVEASPLVFGWIAAAHQLGAGTVAFAAGALRSTTGSYSLAFEVSGILCIAAAFAVLGLRGERRAPAALATA
jgi:predicted MFS family arabinose efflux permease